MFKLLLVDGNLLTYRGYYATAYRDSGVMTNSHGIPVNAVLTLNNTLVKTITKYNPTHILVAFDAGKKTSRHRKFSLYKDGRTPTPPGLIQQMPIAKEMISKMGIACYEIVDIEADDIIGTLANKFKDDANVLILSSDRDLFQLVQENVSIIIPQNRYLEEKLVNINNFFQLYGYNPSQVTDIKGIAGDSSDNLAGVKGIGEKGAIKLLSKYNNLENIYKHLADLPPKIQEKLLESKKHAFLCKDLAQLLNVEIPYQFNDLVFKNKITKELISFFKAYELNSLVKKFKNRVTNDTEEPLKKPLFFKNIIF